VCVRLCLCVIRDTRGFRGVILCP